MEIDLSGVKKDNWGLAGIGLALLLGLMFLGRAFTPEGNRLLTWQEWQVRKLQQAYRAERLRLLEDANRLAELLSSEPDPARAQIAWVLGVRRDLQNGRVEALADERQRVADAAQAVLDWASGIGDYNAAVGSQCKRRWRRWTMVDDLRLRMLDDLLTAERNFRDLAEKARPGADRGVLTELACTAWQGRSWSRCGSWDPVCAEQLEAGGVAQFLPGGLAHPAGGRLGQGQRQPPQGATDTRRRLLPCRRRSPRWSGNWRRCGKGGMRCRR